MTNLSQATINELQNQAFGLMGRIHVLLRRETGRVTDIKYMSMNVEYCRHVLTLGAMTSNKDLQEMCTKLEEIYFGEKGLFDRARPKPAPVKPRSIDVISSRVSIPVTSVQEKTEEAVPPHLASAEHDNVDQHYVGRLR